MSGAFTSQTDYLVQNSEFWGSPVILAPRPITGGIQAGELYCPGFIGPTFMPATNIWDYLRFDAEIPFSTVPFTQTPGIAEVFSNRERRIDKKKPIGKDGARLTLFGMEPANITVNLLIWTPAQYAALRAMWAAIFSPELKAIPSPFQVYHPELAAKGITSIQFIGADGPKPGPTKRSRIFTMRAVEYLPTGTKNATKTVKGTAQKTAVDKKTPSLPSGGTGPNPRPKE